MSKSKARKLAEFLRNLTDDAKINTSAVQQDNVVTSRTDLESKANDTEALVTAASVTSYVSNELGGYVHSTHDIPLTFTGDVTGSGTITDMGATSFNLTLDAETLPSQTGHSGKFLTTNGTVASWASLNISNWDTAYSWGDHSAQGYLTSETHVDSISFSTSTGILTLGRNNLADLTVDLDGRYLTSYTDTNTTYGISAQDVSGGKAIRLTGSDGSTDDVTFAAGSNVTLTRSGDTITIASTDTNTDTNTTDWYVANSAGTNQFKVDKNEKVRFEGSGATSVSFDAATNKVTIASTDTNTETTTTLTKVGNELRYVNEAGTTQTIDLSLYLDDTNLARILSGTMNSSGIATFTRDDGTSFTVDMSVLLDDTNLSRITSASWNTSNGVLTLTRNDSSTVTVDLDGRYYNTGESDGRYVRKTGDTMTGDLILGTNQLNFKTSGNSTSPQILGHRSGTDLNSRFFTSEGGFSYTTFDGGTSNRPSTVTNNANGLFTFNTHSGSYSHQLAFTNGGGVFHRDNHNGTISSWDRIFADDYHPNADKWTTARTNTVTLTGDVTGSGSASVDGTGNWTVSVSTAVGNDSHSHSNYVLNNADDQMNGSLTLYKAAASPTLLTLHNYQSDIAGAANSQGNFIDFKMTDANATYTPQVRVGMIVHDYSGDGGIPSEGTGNFVVYTSQGTGSTGAGNLNERFRVTEDGRLLSNGNQRVFADNYHPNADKWTTARTNTVTLTGDATGSGSASVDGSGNWTVTVNTTVANDSHNHDGRYIPKGGSWFGDLGSHAYVRYNGFQSAGGEFALVTKNGQISTLIDGAYLSYESANGFFGSYNSQYGNLSGIQATGANTVTVKQLDGGSANLTITGNLTVNGSIAQADGFGTLYTFNTTQGLSTSWADVTAIAGNALPTGTYAIQIFINNSDVGGNSYSEYYSGTMSWFGSGTNDNDWNEIPLHNAGHAQNGPLVYARTLRRYSAAEGTMILQLAASGTIASDAIQIKLRRLI